MDRRVRGPSSSFHAGARGSRCVVWLVKYHGSSLNKPRTSLYFSWGGPIFPRRSSRLRARGRWHAIRRIAGPEAEDPGGGGGAQRARQLARSHFRSLIEKLVRISALVDRYIYRYICARRSLLHSVSLLPSLSLSVFAIMENEGIYERLGRRRHLARNNQLFVPSFQDEGSNFSNHWLLRNLLRIHSVGFIDSDTISSWDWLEIGKRYVGGKRSFRIEI